MKKIILVAIISISMHTGFSQRFMHGAGVGVFITRAPYTDAYFSNALIYSPRFNFLETQKLSVSAGIPLSLGFSSGYPNRYDPYTGKQESNPYTFMVNAPLVINLNVGAGSTQKNEKKIVFFVGGGFCYHYGFYTRIVKRGNEVVIYRDGYSSSFGPAGNAGLRFAVGRHQKILNCVFLV